MKSSLHILEKTSWYGQLKEFVGEHDKKRFCIIPEFTISGYKTALFTDDGFYLIPEQTNGCLREVEKLAFGDDYVKGGHIDEGYTIRAIVEKKVWQRNFNGTVFELWTEFYAECVVAEFAISNLKWRPFTGERRTLTSFPQHENGLRAIDEFALGDDDMIGGHIEEN